MAGLFVLLLGLLMLGDAFRMRSPALFAERRPLLERVRRRRQARSPWVRVRGRMDPCIGPVLGGILAIAASGGTTKGAALLAVYSLGLGVPFLLVGLGADRLVASLGWIRRHYRGIAAVSGAFLVAVGVLLMTGLFTQFFGPLARFAPGL